MRILTILGDWIIQERLQNDEWLNALLPSNAPLSTMRIITTSTWSIESAATIVTTTTPPTSTLTTSGGDVQQEGIVVDRSSNNNNNNHIINGNGANGNDVYHGDNDVNGHSNLGGNANINLMSPNSLITSSDYNQSGNDRDDRYDDDDDDDKDDDCVEFNNDDSFNIGSDVVTIDNVDDNDDDDNHHNSGMKGVNPIVTTTTETPATISGFSMKIEKIYQRDHDDENSFYYEKSPSMNVIMNGGRYVKYIKAESGVLRLGSTCVTV